MTDCMLTHCGTAMFVWNDGRFLLQLRADGRDGAGTWSLPGGRIERHEKWRDASVREVAEETGLSVSTWPELVAITHTTEDEAWMTIWSTAVTASREVRLSDESADYQWVTLAGISEGQYPLWLECWDALLDECGGWDGLGKRMAYL